MKIRFRCGCGLINHDWCDWTCHFKYRGFKYGLKRLFNTKIELTNNKRR